MFVLFLLLLLPIKVSTIVISDVTSIHYDLPFPFSPFITLLSNRSSLLPPAFNDTKPHIVCTVDDIRYVPDYTSSAFSREPIFYPIIPVCKDMLIQTDCNGKIEGGYWYLTPPWSDIAIQVCPPIFINQAHSNEWSLIAICRNEDVYLNYCRNSEELTCWPCTQNQTLTATSQGTSLLCRLSVDDVWYLSLESPWPTHDQCQGPLLDVGYQLIVQVLPQYNQSIQTVVASTFTTNLTMPHHADPDSYIYIRLAANGSNSTTQQWTLTHTNVNYTQVYIQFTGRYLILPPLIGIDAVVLNLTLTQQLPPQCV